MNLIIVILILYQIVRKMYSLHLEPYQTTKFRLLLLVWFCCLIICIATFVPCYEKDNYNETVFNGKWISTMATITKISTNHYRCCQVKSCNSCQDGSSYLPCPIMENRLQEGWCSNGKACCQKHQYYCCDDDDYSGTYIGTNITEIQYQDTCQSDYRTCQCYDCLLCIANHRCYNNCGNCSNPRIDYQYLVAEKILTTYQETKCGMNNKKCIQKFIGNYHIGDQRKMYYVESYPNKVMFHKPKYSSGGGIIVCYVVSGISFSICILLSCFLIPTVCLCCKDKYYNRAHWFIGLTHNNQRKDNIPHIQYNSFLKSF